MQRCKLQLNICDLWSLRCHGIKNHYSEVAVTATQARDYFGDFTNAQDVTVLKRRLMLTFSRGDIEISRLGDHTVITCTLVKWSSIPDGSLWWSVVVSVPSSKVIYTFVWQTECFLSDSYLVYTGESFTHLDSSWTMQSQPHFHSKEKISMMETITLPYLHKHFLHEQQNAPKAQHFLRGHIITVTPKCLLRMLSSTFGSKELRIWMPTFT